MYRIKGADKIFGLNFQSVLLDNDKAKSKLLHGDLKDNYIFNEDLFQAGTKLESYQGYGKRH